MGLLDDAIREHLDLKRRRGADPLDIERAEREALGPVRREPTAATSLSDAESPAALLPEVAHEPDQLHDGDDLHADDFILREDDLAPASEQKAAPDVAPGGIAAPGYEHPDFDDFAAAAPEPKHKRRGLFHRRSHESEFSHPSAPLPAQLPGDDPFAPPPLTLEPSNESVGPAQPIDREPSSPPPPLRLTPEAEPGQTVEYDIEGIFADEDGDEPEDAGGEDLLEETPDFLADTPDHDRLWFEQKPPPDFDFDS